VEKEGWGSVMKAQNFRGIHNACFGSDFGAKNALP
jgi:hypothetical protein